MRSRRAPARDPISRPTWTDSDANLDANIVRAAQLLRRLHALGVPAGVQRIDLGRIVSRYLSDLDASGAGGVGGSEALRRRARETAATLDAGATLRLCHTDVHALNIVDDGELRLLDWEYAGAGEPLLDLASLCVFHRYSVQQRTLLLRDVCRARGRAHVAPTRARLLDFRLHS